MKKLFLALSFVSFVSLFANAQEKINIDTEYVAEAGSASYEEWTGGYSPEEINTASEIMDIGRRLGRGIKYQESVQNEPSPFNKGNPAYKYSAARIYGSTKRGADVILIGQTATVDTIKCLKLIIRGYLETAFGYGPEDSRRLAEKICYWNTNGFDDFSYFNSRFEGAVSSVFSGHFSHIGLSSSYKDWKGSILVIPHVSSLEYSGANANAYSYAEESPVVSEEITDSYDAAPSYQEEQDYSEQAASNDYGTYSNNSENAGSDSSRSKSYGSVKSEPEPFLNRTMIIMIAVAAAVLLGVIAVVVIISRRQ